MVFSCFSGIPVTKSMSTPCIEKADQGQGAVCEVPATGTVRSTIDNLDFSQSERSKALFPEQTENVTTTREPTDCTIEIDIENLSYSVENGTVVLQESDSSGAVSSDCSSDVEDHDHMNRDENNEN